METLSDTRVSLDSMYKRVEDFVLQELNTLGIPYKHANYIHEMFSYNLKGGKMMRGNILVDTFRILNPGCGDQELEKCCILGWCVEMLQSAFLIVDDIMDQSQKRRGKLCWYKKEGVGNDAINDSFFIESCIYKIIKKYFEEDSCYTRLVELFHDISFKTEVGQLLDLKTSVSFVSGHVLELQKKDYERMIQFKTSYYSFCLPVDLAFTLSHKIFRDECADISLMMGRLFQINDDYLDCYGDSTITGKIGTDIEEGKCTWLLLKALEKSHDLQKHDIASHYGKNHPSSVNIIKGIYRNLCLDLDFKTYRESLICEIRSKIELLEEDEQNIYKNILLISMKIHSSTEPCDRSTGSA